MSTSEKGNFAKLINSETPVLIDFFAIWCGPSKAMRPILEDISKELCNLRIIKIDMDKNQAIAGKFRFEECLHWFCSTAVNFCGSKAVYQ